MENTAKPVIEVIVEKNRFQVRGCYQNFIVQQADGWEPGCPIGGGSGYEVAIADYIEDWQLKRDEEIEVKVIETKIV